MAASIAPTPASLVADELLSYLQIRKGITAAYLEAPKTVPDGWETYTYRLRLHGRGVLPTPWRGPLALRVYAGPEGLPRLRREEALQQYLVEQNYPVARPVLAEKDPGFLGGPFLLMEWVEGEMLLNRLLRDYLSFWWAPARLAEVHARLHQTPLNDRRLPPPERPVLDRQLEALQAAVRDHGLSGLAPGVDWLRAHRPAEEEPPCLLHLDFHPKNVLLKDGRCTVLDWSEAGVGDRHADVAVALLMIDTAPVEEASPLNRLLMPLGRWATHWGYWDAYRRRLPLEHSRLRYYQAWAALRRLCWYGSWLHAGPQVMGYKPGAARHVRRGHVADLERYFQRYSGVAVRLGLPTASDLARHAAAV